MTKDAAKLLARGIVAAAFAIGAALLGIHGHDVGALWMALAGFVLATTT